MLITDESNAYQGIASAVLKPTSIQEVQSILKKASQNKTLITIAGAKTGVTGGCVPINGGLLLSTENLTRVEADKTRHQQLLKDGFEKIECDGIVIYLNKNKKEAITPPGITLSELNSILAPYHLAYPPDPTELTAFLGGTIATNASGAKSFYYGQTRKWINDLSVVLPTGELFSDQQPAPSVNYEGLNIKNSAGLYLNPDRRPFDSFIGSEGILGVITEARIQLIDRIEETLTVVAFFENLTECFDMVDYIIQHKKENSFLSAEFFDANALEFMRKTHPNIPKHVVCALLFEFPEMCLDNPSEMNPALETIENVLSRYSIIDTWLIDHHKKEDIRLFRHSLPESVNEFARNRMGKIGTDLAVPHQHFRDMYALYEKEGDALDVPYVIFGHIGDDHLHVNFMPETQEDADHVWQAYVRLAKQSVAFGGTLSAEHGIGKKTVPDTSQNRLNYIELMYSKPILDMMRDVKHFYDSNKILNIGNLI